MDSGRIDSKWRGSISYLTKYIEIAIKRIESGPIENKNPQQKFIDQDLEEFCRSHVQEEEKSKKYTCKFCKKGFVGEAFVINHIKNRH